MNRVTSSRPANSRNPASRGAGNVKDWYAPRKLWAGGLGRSVGSSSTSGAPSSFRLQ